MAPRLLKSFARWLLCLSWKDACAAFYQEAAEEYLVDKLRLFDRDRLAWYCTLDPGNQAKALMLVEEQMRHE